MVDPATYGSDSCYLAIDKSVSKAQAKTFLENNGVDAQRVRNFILRDAGDCEIDGQTVRCSWSEVVTATVSYYVFEIDRNIMRKFGGKLQALVDSTGKAHLVTRQEAINFIAAGY